MTITMVMMSLQPSQRRPDREYTRSTPKKKICACTEACGVLCPPRPGARGLGGMGGAGWLGWPLASCRRWRNRAAGQSQPQHHREHPVLPHLRLPLLGGRPALLLAGADPLESAYRYVPWGPSIACAPRVANGNETGRRCSLQVEWLITASLGAESVAAASTASPDISPRI